MNPSLVLFLILLVSNSSLSYAPLGPAWKCLIFVTGVLFPILWARKKTSSLGPGPRARKEWLPPTGPWAFLGLAALAVAARFTWLTGLSVWPNFDESSYGFDAFQLASGAPPRFFYGVSQAPPLFVWGSGLWFKLFGGSLSSLWSFCALVSLSAVPLAYAAARTYFPRSLSLIAAGLVAVGFWPVFLGRFALMTILVLPFECLALWALGSFFQTSDGRMRERAALALGAVWGLGCYTHLHWPIVVAVTFLPFAWGLWNKRGKRGFSPWRPLSLALGSAVLLAAPLLLSALRSHYGGYLAHLWAFHGDFSWHRQVAVWLSCLTSPFWGMDPDVHTYQPVWGGFLNPVLTSLFFLGIATRGRTFPWPFHRWVLVSLGICLLPGLLTQDQETFRLFPMVPFLILGILAGLGTLMEKITPKRALVWVFLLGSISCLLDGRHLFVAFHRVWDDPKTWSSYTKSFGRYRAFQVLEEWRRTQGPGWIFPDFVQGLPDQSLAVATYGYNAILDPALRNASPHWAAVLTNVNYQPFLKSRFPEGRAYALTQELPSGDGGWMLFIFPTQGIPPGTLALWVEAQRALEPFLDQHLCFVMGGSMGADIRSLGTVEPAFRGDPYLRASYWEKMADLRVKSGDWAKATEDLERAAQEGLPAAHLYERAGVLHLLRGEKVEARKDFEAARHCPLDLTDSKVLLGDLQARVAP